MIRPTMPPSAFSNAVVRWIAGSETDNLIADDCDSWVTLGLVNLGEVAQEVSYQKISIKASSLKSTRGHTWRVVHASNKVARADRSTRVAFG